MPNMPALPKLPSSWKTSLCGFLAVITALAAFIIYPLFDGDKSTKVNFVEFLTALTGAVGLFYARDKDKSSEDEGIKPKEKYHEPYH